MSTHNKKKLHLRTVSVDLGCSCRRTTSKLFSFFNPKLCTKRAATTSSTSSFSKQMLTTTTNSTSSYSSTSSLYHSDDPSSSYYSSLQYLLDAESAFKASKPVKGFGRIDGEGVAVEKDSDDPYLDFRHSMLQMILENGIYSKEDMRELLNCFLQLNSPYYHGVIVRAFTEIWNGVFAVKSPAASNNNNNNNYYSSPGGFRFGYYNSRESASLAS